jgi:glycosyltransferase involved in cell wall biosynthesis
VLLDDFDPPVEWALSFNKNKPSIIKLFLGRFVDLVSMHLAKRIIASSPFWREYLSGIYGISQTKFLVVKGGSIVNKQPCICVERPRRNSNAMELVYAGTAMEVKGIDNLIRVVEGLKDRGFQVNLRICGETLMNLPDWVHLKSYDWVTLNRDVLSAADVCIVPYPPDRIAFSRAVLAKVFDYMASGKPIVSTNLAETGSMIREVDCGLVATSWEEFSQHLERLFGDPLLAKRLGENGRCAAINQGLLKIL